MDVPKVLVLIGFAIAAIGCLTWRAGGRAVALSGSTLAAMGASMSIGDSHGSLQLLLLVIWTVLVLGALVRAPRADWRRPEMLLLGFSTAVLMATVALGSFMSIQARVGLLVLLCMSTAAFLIVTAVRLGRELRSRRRRVAREIS